MRNLYILAISKDAFSGHAMLLRTTVTLLFSAILVLFLGVANASVTSILGDLNSLSAFDQPDANIQLQIQRQQYSEALRKLDAGDVNVFRQLKSRLHNYPLYRYLDYLDFKQRLSELKNKDFDAFEKRNADSFLASYARGVWLWELSRRKHWYSFLKYYDDRSDKSLSCYATWANINSKKFSWKEKVALAKEKYLVGFDQPAACDPIFTWLKAQKQLTSKLRWQRVSLLVDKRNWKFARAVSKKLPQHYQKQFKQWEAIRHTPEVIETKAYAKDTLEHRKMARYAVNRVLNNDLVEAEELWARMKQRYRYSEKSIYAMDRRLAVRSAQRHYPDALQRLEALPEDALNEQAREWRVRAALRVQDWKGAYKGLLALNDEEQQRDEWVYWRGRTEDQLGNHHVAQLAYEKLAQERGYYSFLAAERLGTRYEFTPYTPSVSFADVQMLAQRPAFMRVRELLEQDQMNYARVEWSRAVRELSKEDKMAAGQLAHRWRWHEQAIRIAASLGHYNDLDLRFAMPYRQMVEQRSTEVGIDPNWAQAIMRRESAYAADARSGVGARGLMQLMPNTAKHVAKKQGWPRISLSQLNEPDINIRLGTAYLSELTEELSPEIPLVTAAYNAGPHRVRKWMPKDDEVVPMDIWIDTIPFNETRKYVRAVSEYMSIFNWRSQGQPTDYRKALLYTKKDVSKAMLAKTHSNTP